MQPQPSDSKAKKILTGIIIAILVVVAVPILIVLFLGISHGNQGDSEANYMKKEMTKITLPGSITQKSVDCHDVELRQECYFTYTTTLSKTVATDSIKQSFTDAGYLTTASNTSSYEDRYSIGVFQNDSTSLYASVTYRLDSELAPAYQTSVHDSQVEIQIYKL